MGAMISGAQIPPLAEPTDLKSSECWTCHADSTNGPPIPQGGMYVIHGLPDVTIPVGEKALFEVAVENVWTAELREITGALDLTNSPGLEFASEKEPISDVRTGVVEGEPGTDPQFSEERFTVPPGATDLVIRVERDPQSSQVTDLDDFRLQLWAPGKPLDSAPSYPTINNGGAGDPETFELHGLDEIAEAGTGEWVARIVVAPPSETNPDPAAYLDHPYQFSLDIDFKGTGVPIQFVDLGDTTLLSAAERPGQRVYLGWQILAVTIPNDPVTIPVDVILIGHYDHAPNHSSYDDWRYIQTINVEVIPDASNNAVVLRSVAPDEVVGGSDFSWGILSEIVGYVSAVLILASIYTGGMFGKASRRQLNAVFGTAKRRVAFHNFLSYIILLAAVVHTIIFLVEPAFHWTLGLLWGSIAILGMIGLGLTGALQVPMIRKWNYAVWRWSHFYLSIGTIVFTIVHILLDGVHFADLQEALGWQNFLDPSNRA